MFLLLKHRLTFVCDYDKLYASILINPLNVATSDGERLEY